MYFLQFAREPNGKHTQQENTQQQEAAEMGRMEMEKMNAELYLVRREKRRNEGRLAEKETERE